MHFTRRRRFNLTVGACIGERLIRPGQTMRILGVWLDPALRWKGHLDALAGKLDSQMRALSCLTGSTWGLPLTQGRLVYNAVIRSAIAHGALAWHQPRTREGTQRIGGMAAKLSPKQNKCLRQMTGAYRRTPTRTIEAESFTEPLDLYLNTRVARAAQRMEESGMARRIEDACKAVRRGLRRRRQNVRRSYVEVVHPSPVPVDWARDWAENAKQKVMSEWQRRWRSGERPWGEIHGRPPDKSNLKLYKGLTKARCSILIQLRSGMTGLAAFLYWRKVPGYSSPTCECGNGAETPVHVLVHCPRYAEIRRSLMRGGRVDTGALLGSPDGALQVSGWWLRQGILGQFQLARALELGLD